MKEKKVWIVGHKNPDTDSICAAITYEAYAGITSLVTALTAIPN